MPSPHCEASLHPDLVCESCIRHVCFHHVFAQCNEHKNSLLGNPGPNPKCGVA